MKWWTSALLVVEYRSSGVMTFIVGGDAVMYERDLGPDSAKAP